MSLATTRTQIWVFTLTDGSVLRYTRHDADLAVGGNLYKAAIGGTPSAIERDTDVTAANMQIDVLINNAEISRADLLGGRYLGARMQIIDVDWTDPDGQPQHHLLTGFLGDVQMIGNRGLFELAGSEIELANPVGRTIQLPCDADLGDARCGYALTADACTLTSVTSRLAFVDLSLGAADGHYNFGKLVWLTGDNAGITCDIKRYVAASHTVELHEPTPYPMQAGDTADIYRGCDKTMDTCVNTFSNGKRHRGNPYLPGVKDLISGNIA